MVLSTERRTASCFPRKMKLSLPWRLCGRLDEKSVKRNRPMWHTCQITSNNIVFRHLFNRSLDKLNATLPDLVQPREKEVVESVEKVRRLFHPSHNGATTNCGKRGKIRDFPTLPTANEWNGASRISWSYFTGSRPIRKGSDNRKDEWKKAAR